MGSTNKLVIELERVTVEQQFLGTLRAELESGGMKSGRLALGDVTADPGMIYFLWHESGAVPVSMLAESEKFKDEAGTRETAQVFLAKWKRRLH